MKKRYTLGVLKVDAEPGTLFGPNQFGETLVAVERVEGGVTVGFATNDDIDSAMQQPEPRSVTEARLRIARQ